MGLVLSCLNLPLNPSPTITHCFFQAPHSKHPFLLQFRGTTSYSLLAVIRKKKKTANAHVIGIFSKAQEHLQSFLMNAVSTLPQAAKL